MEKWHLCDLLYSLHRTTGLGYFVSSLVMFHLYRVLCATYSSKELLSILYIAH